ncbi:hypothetical protein CFVI92203_09230 [Campylobacter fetus subsp. venerealis cfvi92/203]|uniref:hypothetical protein n=1 Tax=Campylobacter fetus TaxID=196 RepID=UPI000818B630|nr:hypothetical protein [Campylobacter fetus]OCS40112.1 hypothetical protein CFVI92203_09230 [Campylobacter fetus subsp. venerealis cfvi92/203]
MTTKRTKLENSNLDKAGSFIGSIEKDFKALISISNGELIAIYSDMQAVMSLLSIHWQMKEQEMIFNPLNDILSKTRSFGLK